MQQKFDLWAVLFCHGLNRDRRSAKRKPFKRFQSASSSQSLFPKLRVCLLPDFATAFLQPQCDTRFPASATAPIFPFLPKQKAAIL